MINKPWHMLTRAEINQHKREVCRHCEYLTTGEYIKNRTCEYGLMTGHSRLCSPFDCIRLGKFKPREGSRRGKEFTLRRSNGTKRE